jgi:hypothetical protein
MLAVSKPSTETVMSDLPTQDAPSALPRVSHYGTIHIGDLAFDGVVLEDGTRGYVSRQLLQTIGFKKNIPVPRFRQILAEIAPNALSLIDKSGSPVVLMPHGGHAKFLPAGILSEIVTGVIDAALEGTLHTQRRNLIQPCKAINKALTVTGEVALIDEATGYQYHREPDALQDLFGRLIREHCADWERRFHPDYYASLFRLFGWKYEGQTQRPVIIGQITDHLVYGAVFPREIMVEVRERRGEKSAKLHQWLKDGGISLLERQIDAVRLMADSSVDYGDFKNRCLTTFKIPGQLGFIFPTPVAVA